MHSELPVVARSRGHRWMVTGFPLCGILLLTSLMFRVAPNRETSHRAVISVQVAQTDLPPAPLDRKSVPAGPAQPVPTESTPPKPHREAAGLVSESVSVEFFGSRPEPESRTPIDQPLPHSTSRLISSLEKHAVEVDLYRDPQAEVAQGYPTFASQVSETRSQLTTDIAELRRRVSRPTRITSGSRKLLEEVPGAAERMKRSLVEMQSRLETQLMAAERYEPLRGWLAERPDLQGLPLSMGESCRLSSTQAKVLNHVSSEFGRMRFTAFGAARSKLLQERTPASAAVSTDIGRTPAQLEFTLGNANQAFAQSVKDDPDKFRGFLRTRFWNAESIPGVVQIMQGLNEQMRLLTLEIISKVSAPVATTAIAQRAVFDPAASVRHAAVTELQNREPAEFRATLLSGLRYVWAPAAQHAAEAIIAVNDQEARADLLDLSRKPDPRKPVQDESGGWSVHELTRVNHLRNCLLCHAPAVEATVKPTGAIPDPYKSIPVAYYSGSSLASVRADVTYLRQDFSVVHEVEKPGPWPSQQRFDYFVRKRELTSTEANEMLSRDWSDDYPQRRFALYALQQLDAISNPRTVAATD